MHHLAVQHLDSMPHAIVARDARHVCELHIPAFCRRTDLMIYTIVLCLVTSAVDQSTCEQDVLHWALWQKETETRDAWLH